MKINKMFVLMISSLGLLAISQLVRAEEPVIAPTANNCLSVDNSTTDKLLGRKPHAVCVGDDLLYAPWPNYLLGFHYEMGIGWVQYGGRVKKTKVVQVFAQDRKFLIVLDGKEKVIPASMVTASNDGKLRNLRSKFGVEIKGCALDAYLCEGSTFRYKDSDQQEYKLKVLKVYANGFYSVDFEPNDGSKDHIVSIIPDAYITQTRHNPGSSLDQAKEVSCDSRLDFPLKKVIICKGNTVLNRDGQVFKVIRVFDNKIVQVSDETGQTSTIRDSELLPVR